MSIPIIPAVLLGKIFMLIVLEPLCPKVVLWNVALYIGIVWLTHLDHHPFSLFAKKKMKNSFFNCVLNLGYGESNGFWFLLSYTYVCALPFFVCLSVICHHVLSVHRLGNKSSCFTRLRCWLQCLLLLYKSYIMYLCSRIVNLIT